MEDIKIVYRVFTAPTKRDLVDAESPSCIFLSKEQASDYTVQLEEMRGEPSIVDQYHVCKDTWCSMWKDPFSSEKRV